MEAAKSSVAMAVRARRWKLGKVRRAHAATSRASTPGGKARVEAKAEAKSTARRAGATARASTPGAPSRPAASKGATASASSSGARPASSSTRTPTSASTPESVLFKFDTCLKTLVKKREPLSPAQAQNWLTAVAHGGSVEVEGKRVKLTPGIRRAQCLDISKSFMVNYPKLFASLRSAMRAHGSRWTAPKAGQKDGGVRIAGKTDLTAFLLKVQHAAAC